MAQPLPSPEEVRSTFAKMMEAGASMEAAQWLWCLERDCGYVRQAATDSPWHWRADTAHGAVEVTVNTAKPEKDPRAIAEAACGQAPTGRPLAPGAAGLREPLCDLCWENEGWPGSPQHPAKPGLRIAALSLGGQPWGFQFSPYAYFDEHCIALSAQHRPMAIDAAAIRRVLELVGLFPRYFFGFNADLPIVGGSILSHDHCQGGLHTFPVMEAPVRWEFPVPGHREVKGEVLQWPAATLRLKSRRPEPLLGAAEAIRAAWFAFDDGPCALESHGVDGSGRPVRHSTLNPIARKTEAGFELYLVLRNNRTTKGRPWGLFHPTEDLFHIKRENIGLIEIMGLAILPGRLAKELPAVERALRHGAASGQSAEGLRRRLEGDASTSIHGPWAAGILSRCRPQLAQEAQGGASVPLGPTMRQEVAEAFGEIVAATNVFKHDEGGWERFLATLPQGA